MSLMMSGLSSIPTINNRRLIQRLEKDWNATFLPITDGKNKLIITPVRIYPIIIGCFNIFIIHKTMRTIPMMILNDMNICSVII